MLSYRRQLYDSLVGWNPFPICFEGNIDTQWLLVSSHPEVSVDACSQDSLLNSSKNFDSTGFRELAKVTGEEASLKGRNSSFFVHTFESEGTFVFASSLHKSRIAVVRVLTPGMNCPGDTG